MSTQFITNQKKLLADVVNNILPSTRNLYFLIGYFYFSGFEEIYKRVEDKEIKILVGLEVEYDLANKIKEVEIIQQVNIPRGKIRDDYYKSLVNLFNDTDFFDSREKQEAVRRQTKWDSLDRFFSCDFSPLFNHSTIKFPSCQ